MVITDKLDDNLYMCANGDIVTLVDASMDGTTYHSASGKYAKRVGFGSKIEVLEDGSLNADSEGDYLNIFGFKKKLDKLGGTKLGKAWRKGRDFTGKMLGGALLFVPRGAFLVLIRVNFLGMATSLYNMREGSKVKGSKDAKAWHDFMESWKSRWIGDPKQMNNYITQGSKRKPMFKKVEKVQAKGADGKTYEYTYITGDSDMPAYLNMAVETAIVSGAAPTTAAMAIIEKAGKAAKFVKENKDTIDTISSLAKSQEKSGVPSVSPKDAKELEKIDKGSFFSRFKMPIIIGGALLLGGIGFFIYKKIKK